MNAEQLEQAKERMRSRGLTEEQIEARIADRGRAGRPGGGPGGRPDFSRMTPEQLEQVKERMRARGLTEEQIEDRIKRARERS